MHDTALGWRFVNPKMEEMGHTDSLGVTAEEQKPEELAGVYDISREAQDRFPIRSHEKVT